MNLTATDDNEHLQDKRAFVDAMNLFFATVRGEEFVPSPDPESMPVPQSMDAAPTNPVAAQFQVQLLKQLTHVSASSQENVLLKELQVCAAVFRHFRK